MKLRRVFFARMIAHLTKWIRRIKTAVDGGGPCRYSGDSKPAGLLPSLLEVQLTSAGVFFPSTGSGGTAR